MPTTAQMTADPWRRTFLAQPAVRAPTNAPTAGAANGSSTTPGPRWNCEMARNVNSACGIPKIIAIRSITNVDWIKRFRRTNANPLLHRRPPRGAPRLAIGRHRMHQERREEEGSVRHEVDRVRRPETEPRDQQAADRRPTMPTVCHITWLRATADGIKALPTSRGVIAERVGLSTELTNAWSAFAR